MLSKPKYFEERCVSFLMLQYSLNESLLIFWEIISVVVFLVIKNDVLEERFLSRGEKNSY